MNHTCTKHAPGQYGCYSNHHCRCDACRATGRRRRKMVAHGIRMTVPIAPVRDHITRLGVPNSTVSQLSGVSLSTVGEIVRGVRGVVSVKTAEAILSVRVQTATAGLVPSAGTVRRLQALVAIGHPQNRLAAELGTAKQQVNKVIHGGYRATEAAWARRVADLYERWWDQPAPPGRASTLARTLAARNGWAVPMSWDDGHGPHGIDNPAATPYRCARTDTRPHGATRENVAELSAQGLTDEGIAHRLGITVNAVQTARRRAAA